MYIIRENLHSLHPLFSIIQGRSDDPLPRMPQQELCWEKDLDSSIAINSVEESSYKGKRQAANLSSDAQNCELLTSHFNEQLRTVSASVAIGIQIWVWSQTSFHRFLDQSKHLNSFLANTFVT